MKLNFLLIAILFGLLTPNYAQKKKNESKETAKYKIYVTSKLQVRELKNKLFVSVLLTKNWVHINDKYNINGKILLKEIHNSIIPSLIINIDTLSTNWNPSEKEMLEDCKKLIYKLLESENYIMQELNTDKDYKDPLKIFEIKPMVEDKGEICYIYDGLKLKLDLLLSTLSKISDEFLLDHIRSF